MVVRELVGLRVDREPLVCSIRCEHDLAIRPADHGHRDSVNHDGDLDMG